MVSQQFGVNGSSFFRVKNSREHRTFEGDLVIIWMFSIANMSRMWMLRGAEQWTLRHETWMLNKDELLVPASWGWFTGFTTNGHPRFLGKSIWQPGHQEDGEGHNWVLKNKKQVARTVPFDHQCLVAVNCHIILSSQMQVAYCLDSMFFFLCVLFFIYMNNQLHPV